MKAGIRTLTPIEQKYIEEEPRVSKQVIISRYFSLSLCLYTVYIILLVQMGANTASLCQKLLKPCDVSGGSAVREVIFVFIYMVNRNARLSLTCLQVKVLHPIGAE